MIRDRGKMKWTSMMLPEHVSMLREWAHEDSYETRNELDEQQVEAMNMIIMEALEYNKPVVIRYYRKASRRYGTVEGHIHYCNEQAQKLHIVDEDGAASFVFYQEIMDVQLKN